MSGRHSPVDTLAKKIFQVSHLTGRFRLRSGIVSDHYFDKYQFESDPELLRALASAMVPLLDDKTEMLAALELGGVPLATAIALTTGLPMVFVRKTAKDYGTAKALEGPPVSGKRLTVIEDVVTTGGAIVDEVGKLRLAGALVSCAVCAIWRGETLAPLEKSGIELRWALSGQDLVDR